MTPHWPRTLVILCLFLAACAPTIKTAGLPIDEPSLADEAMLTADGLRLPVRSWLPKGDPAAVIIGLHGFNDYGNAFDDPGRYLANRGIAVYAYDQRGFGASPDPGYWAGQQALSDDLVAFTRLLHQRYPDKPLFLLGESMGGAVIMVTMARLDAPKVDGVILAAPAVWNRGSMGVFQQAALWLTYHTVPWMTLTGRGLDIQPSDNIPMLRRLGADPLVIKETRVDAIHGLCNLMDSAAAVASQLHVPVLALYGDKDQVVPAEPAFRALRALRTGPGPATTAIYGNGYHMLLRDLEAYRVLGDVTAWIGHPEVPLPSGADRHAVERLGDPGAVTKAVANN